MTLTLYAESVVISCDHPDCGNEVVSASAGDARSLAKAHGWRQRERPMWIDPWFLCPAHKGWRPEE